MTQRLRSMCGCGYRRVRLGFCYDGKKCVCVSVCVQERGKLARRTSRWECGRWLWCVRAALTRICEIPVRDSFMSWKGCKRRERRESSKRELQQQCPLSAVWGSSWRDTQWPKGNLFRPGRGASHYILLFFPLLFSYPWKWMDGQCLSLQSICEKSQLCHDGNKGDEASTHHHPPPLLPIAPPSENLSKSAALEVI